MTLTTPLISFIIPVYNNALYVEESLLSLLAHSTNNIEVIIINDGSTDASEQHITHCIELYPLIAIKYIKQANAGVSAARNVGLEQATGVYIAFLDSDDLLHQDYLPILLPLLTTQQYDIINFEFLRFHHQPPVRKISSYPSGSVTKEIVNNDDRFLLLFQKGEWYLFRQIIKKALFDGVNFPVGRRYEDMNVMPFIYLQTTFLKVLYLPDILYFYRHNLLSITYNIKPQDSVDKFYTVSKVLSYLKNNHASARNKTASMLLISQAFSEARRILIELYRIPRYDALSLEILKQTTCHISPKVVGLKNYCRICYPQLDILICKLQIKCKQLLAFVKSIEN